MKEVIQNIVEKIQFKKKEQFFKFLEKCLFRLMDDPSQSTYSQENSVMFKMDLFYNGLPEFEKEFGPDRKYEAGVEAISVVCTELGIDIEKEECFILYHLRKLGKFKTTSAKLQNEIHKLYAQYPDYSLDEHEFSYSLKELMRKRFIDFRKGNIQLKKSMIIRYRSRRR